MFRKNPHNCHVRRNLPLWPVIILVVLALITPPTPQTRLSMAEAMVAPAPARQHHQAVPSQAHLRRAPFEGPYQAELVNVVDGDTFEARIRIWFGQEAKEALADFLVLGQIILSDVAMDKYGGRVLANVMIDAPDPASQAATTTHDNIASLMLRANLARPYFGGRREGWCEESVFPEMIRPERQASRNGLPADNKK